jgi:large subunit ribosomal protein LP1
MASKPVNQLNAAEKEQLAVSYAAFVLSGQGAQVTADSINNVLKAANLTASQGLVKAFAKTLATRSVNDFLGSVGGSGSASTATT